MKKYFVVIVLSVVFGNLFSQNFSVHQSRNVSFLSGTSEYKNLSSPMKVSITRENFRMTNQQGKVYLESEIELVKELGSKKIFKFTDRGYCGYFSLVKDEDFDTYELQIPWIIDGMIISYEFFNQIKQ